MNKMHALIRVGKYINLGITQEGQKEAKNIV